MRAKSSKQKVSNVIPLKPVTWPLGMVFDGGANDIDLLRSTIQPSLFVEHLHHYLDLVGSLKSGKQSLYKVQIVEGLMKNVFVPANGNDQGEVLFYINDLYKNGESPLNVEADGFSRRIRSIAKIK